MIGYNKIKILIVGMLPTFSLSYLFLFGLNYAQAHTLKLSIICGSEFVLFSQHEHEQQAHYYE